MERRGGCCTITRHGGETTDVAWRVGWIMLKYRPIAPKPAAMAPATTDLKSTPSGGRLKRKAPACSVPGTRPGSKRGRKPKKANKTPAPVKTIEEREEKCSSSSSTTTTTSVDSSSLVTLPLMPESPGAKPALVEADQENKTVAAVVVPTPVRPVGSWVTVEGLIDIWKREVPVMPGIASDEAPAIVSDGWGRVTWANTGFKNLVTGGDDGEEVRVGLVTRGLVPAWGTCNGFTCRVRVKYACRKKGKVSLAAPCDVWRVDGGGYAWQLDVKAALSLSLPIELNISLEKEHMHGYLFKVKNV